MIQITPQMRILLSVEPADFRCGIDGLVALCRTKIGVDPFQSTMFVFRNRRATALRCLVYDGQGFWLCHKRLSSGRFAWWPKDSTSGSKDLLAHELQLFRGEEQRDSAQGGGGGPRRPVADRHDAQGARTDRDEPGAQDGRRADRERPYHYLGYSRPVGEHVKYLVSAQGRPIACAAWSSAPRHLGPRDRFIGWTPEARKRNVRLLAYNTRFLILPWVRVPHLASYLLGRMARELPLEWERLYGHPIVYLETFTDPARFVGTCYRAANWIFLGKTTGRGNNAPTMDVRVPIKEILGYPLSPRFRELLGSLS